MIPVEFIDEGREQDYDKEKYREMLLEAAETVVISDSTGLYLEKLVAAKTESGGISSGSNVKGI